MSEEGKISIEDLAKSVKAVAEGQAALTQTVQNLVKGAQSSAVPPREEPPQKLKATELSKEQLEGLDRSGFLQHIMENINVMLANTVTDIKTELGNVSTKVDQTNINAQVAKARAEHPDFDQWREEIADKFRQNDKLSVEDAYTLARKENPSKAKEIDDKLQEEAKADEPEGSKGKETKSSESGKKPEPDKGEKGQFGGMSTERTTGKDDEPDQAKSFEDAADDAWEKSLEQAGDGIQSIINGNV